MMAIIVICTVKPVLSGHSKRRQKIGFQDRLSLNAGEKYYRMLQEEHSEILSTCIKLPFVIKMFVLSIFEWPLKTGFTVLHWYGYMTQSTNFGHVSVSLLVAGNLGSRENERWSSSDVLASNVSPTPSTPSASTPPLPLLWVKLVGHLTTELLSKSKNMTKMFLKTKNVTNTWRMPPKELV